MKNDSLRIAFIGAHGTGKTTLAKVVSEKLNLPLIAEGVREKMVYYKNEGYDKYDLDHYGGVFQLFQDELLIERLFEENEKVHFISDRSTIDNFAYYATNQICKPLSEKTFKAYEYLCLSQSKKYSHLFLVPVSFPAVADGVRETTYQSQIIIENFIRGFCEKNNIRYIEIDTNCNTVEERVKFVLDVVNG